eukprot:scaffold5530_cov283-Chaetoceros_neogracile.AAC.41
MKEGLASAGKSKQPKLLYRASRDGWATADFHRMCDGRVQRPQFLKDHAGIGPVKMSIKSDMTESAVYHNET